MHQGRYPLTYRQDEVNRIAQLGSQAQSAAFVGIAGTGKSNLIRYVCDPLNLAPYIGDYASQVRFAVVDINTWAKTPLSLWQMMFRALMEATKDVPASDPAAITFSDPTEQALYLLRNRTMDVCKDGNLKIVFVLDDADDLLLKGSTDTIEQLNSLRNDGNRDRIAYHVYTKKLPHILLRRNNPDHKFKFFDLFSSHVYALSMYSHTDALQMLAHLDNRAGRVLDRRDYGPILALAGGHARLIYVLFGLWDRDIAQQDALVARLSRHESVRAECYRIMEGLHRQEQEAAIAAAQGIYELSHVSTIKHLVTRGILIDIKPFVWFSSLMPTVLKYYDPKGDM